MPVETPKRGKVILVNFSVETDTLSLMMQRYGGRTHVVGSNGLQDATLAEDFQ